MTDEPCQGQWMATIFVWVLFTMLITTLLAGWVLLVWVIGEAILL